MSENEITKEDIAFLITQLTTALEVFSRQLNNSNNVIAAGKPKKTKTQALSERRAGLTDSLRYDYAKRARKKYAVIRIKK